MLDHGTAVREWPTSVLSEHVSRPISEWWVNPAAAWHGDASEKSFQVRLGRSVVRLETTGRAIPDWLVGVIAELNEIAKLAANWDSYGAVPIEQRTLEHAFQLIVDLMDVDTPPPQVGATVVGGVEFEWHHEGKDLEVQVLGPFQVHAYFFDEETNEEWEESIGTNLDRIRPYLRRLSR